MTENDNSIQPSSSSLRQYWFFFSGQLTSLFGSSVVQFALIWWITVTASVQYPGQVNLILALATVAGFAPFIITSLFSGVLVDRWNRKTVIMVADASQALITAVLMVMFYIDFVELPYILLVLALRAVAQGFQNPAVQAIIPLMVPYEKLTRVNSFQYLFTTGINLVGPVIGAILIETLGVESMASILWVDVITFAIAIVPTLLIYIPDITKAKREAVEKPSFRSEFMEGIGFLRNNNGLLTLLVTFTVINILLAPMVLLPNIVLDVNLLAGSADTLAIIMAFTQGGSILSSAASAKWKIFRNNAQGVAISQFIMYVTFGLGALAAFLGNLWAFVALSFISGMMFPLANISSQTIWQSCVPPELQGRVMSVRQAIAWIMIPVAQLISGALADIVGIVNLMYVCAIIGLIFLTFAVLRTDLLIVERILGLETTEEIDTQEIPAVGD